MIRVYIKPSFLTSSLLRFQVNFNVTEIIIQKPCTCRLLFPQASYKVAVLPVGWGHHVPPERRISEVAVPSVKTQMALVTLSG